MTTTMSHPKFELCNADTWPNPWPMYAALRDRDPVHHVIPENAPNQDYYVLSRHADIWAAAADHETFSSAQGLTVNYGELEMIGLADNPPMVMQDPPVHTEFRKLVARGFMPRQVELLEPKVREFVIERLERLQANGGKGDIVAELFKPLPSMVVAHYLGVPEEDRSQFDRWTEAVVAATVSEDGVASAGDAIGEMMAYFSGLIERRRTDPQDDTVSHLVAAGVGADGDIKGLLSVLAFTFTMVTGGNDTTTGMLGGSVQLLQRNPDQRQLLVDKPELIRDAVEELLRLTSPCRAWPAPPPAMSPSATPQFRRTAKCCCSTARATATNASSGRTLPSSTCNASRTRSSPSATAPTTASATRRRRCRPAWRWKSCWPAARTTRSTNPGSSGPAAVTCDARCRCPSPSDHDGRAGLAVRSAR